MNSSRISFLSPTDVNCGSFKRIVWAIVTGILILSGQYAQAQQKLMPKNLEKFDLQWIHFGFGVGINMADFIIKPVENFNQLDSLYVVESSSAPGFHLGIVSNLRLGEHFDLRFTPDLAFSQRNLTYTFVKNGVVQESVVKTVESTYLDFPLYFKFKSSRIKNYRVFVLAGVKYSLDMASQEKVKDTETKQIVKVYKNNYCYEFGIGLDCYMEFFKFSPEIKLSQSINNLLVPDVSIYSKSINSLFSQILYVTFTFE